MQVIRQLGIGDVEHVRSQLFNIGAISPIFMKEQLEAIFKVADKLGMMARVHFNAEALSTKEFERAMNYSYEHTAHQLEPYEHLAEDEFQSFFQRLDIVITLPSGDVVVDELSAKILEAWTASGGRYTNGNFGLKSRDQLLADHPQYGVDYKPYWEIFRSKP